MNLFNDEKILKQDYYSKQIKKNNFNKKNQNSVKFFYGVNNV